MISKTPKPPYYAVIFSSKRTGDEAGYAEMGARMEALAAQQPGYLGIEHAGDAQGSITVSYWSSLEAIAAWRAHAEHAVAQATGRERWYARYTVRVTKVERAYDFESHARR